MEWIFDVPWYVWLLLWPVVAVIVAVPLGKFIRIGQRRRRATETTIDEQIAQEWRSPRDEQFRNRWH
jgi:hypothetical protein